MIDTPKTWAGERTVSLDFGTAELIPAHLRMIWRERFAAEEAYQDHGLLFCREDGTPYAPTSSRSISGGWPPRRTRR
ncbi:hypothetical protein [Spirillospora sp. NPDC048819]|uniref:hypothetical protein n=1 Tax=Spirillospora sp. NPDC048819 TaxID=3155268 RepID=UPI0033F4C427